MSTIKVKDAIDNPQNYKQCIACRNPVPLDAETCHTCDSEYFVPNDEKDFSHFRFEVADDEDMEIEV